VVFLHTLNKEVSSRSSHQLQIFQRSSLDKAQGEPWWNRASASAGVHVKDPDDTPMDFWELFDKTILMKSRTSLG
jgi:hypothetical protein